MRFRKFVNAIAFIGIIFLAVAMLLSAIPGKFGNWCDILVTIAMCVEVAVGFVYAYLYARSKQQFAFMLIFMICALIIITMLIVKMVG